MTAECLSIKEKELIKTIRTNCFNQGEEKITISKRNDRGGALNNSLKKLSLSDPNVFFFFCFLSVVVFVDRFPLPLKKKKTKNGLPASTKTDCFAVTDYFVFDKVLYSRTFWTSFRVCKISTKFLYG